MQAQLKERRILSSLPLAMFLYFDGYYIFAFMLTNFILIFYKSFEYTYSHGQRAVDAIILVLWALSDMSRLFLAKKGNICEDVYSLLINLGLCLPVILGHIFFYLWQAIVLDLDKVMSAIGLVFVVFEIILSSLAIMTFMTNKRQV